MPIPTGAQLRERIAHRARAARHCTALHPRALRNPHVLSDGTVTIYCGSCNRVVTLREPSQYGGKDRSDVNQPGHGGALASDSVMGSLLFD